MNLGNREGLMLPRAMLRAPRPLRSKALRHPLRARDLIQTNPCRRELLNGLQNFLIVRLSTAAHWPRKPALFPERPPLTL